MVSDLRYLPLVDDEERPVSIVTSRDLIDFLSARFESSERGDEEKPQMRKTR